MDNTDRAAPRQRVALERAAMALAALADEGLAGWVVGSLARGRFNDYSDVDFVVDCDRSREYDAFLAIERAMKDFPFHMVPFRRLREDAIPFMMDGAIDAAGIVARQAEA